MGHDRSFDGRRLALGDESIELLASDPFDRRQLTEFFGPLQVSDLPKTLTVELSREAIVPPAGEPSMIDGPIQRWEVSEGLTLVHRDGRIARATPSRIVIGEVTAGDEGRRAFRQLLFSALSWWLERHESLLMHAAAVGDGCDVILVAGPTGSGKSTCFAAALHRGWQVHSDDATIVRRRGGTYQAFGLPKPPTIAADQARRLDRRSSELAGDGRRRVVIEPDVLSVGWRPIRAVVLVDHDDGPGCVERLDHQSALTVIASSWIEGARPEALRRHLGSLAAIAAIPAFRLAHTVRQVDRMERAAELLGEIYNSTQSHTSLDSDQ